MKTSSFVLRYCRVIILSCYYLCECNWTVSALIAMVKIACIEIDVHASPI
jgi:hypothetical protein